MDCSAAFREVVLVDTEFTSLPGERPVPIGLVAHELRSNRWFRIFRGKFGLAPPYATGPDVLFCAYYASAELGCYRVLNWPIPLRILDLFVEFRDRTNGLPTANGASLFGALNYFGLELNRRGQKEGYATGYWCRPMGRQVQSI